MTSLFWGLRLEPGKRYSTTVDKAFHVSMAALDCTSVKSETEILSVMLEERESAVPFILCNLNKGRVMQSELDLNFMTGDRVTFFCKGNGIVHLSGYIVPDEDDFGQLGDEDEDDEDEEEEEDEEDSITESAGDERLGKKKLTMNGLVAGAKRALEEATSKKNKKKKLLEMPEEVDFDEDDDDEEEDDLDMLEEIDSDMGEEDESDEDEEEDDDEEEEEEAPKQSPPTSSKKDKKKAQPQQTTPNLSKQQQPNKQKTPNGMTPQLQSGKKDKKNKGGETPSGETPKGGKGKEEGTPQKKTLEGGVSIKDIRQGQGALCKNGKMATVYYTGRLKSNHKVFDSVLQGAGFKFRVGRGEVIKGWDIGVNGMKVGGKRFITCPPQMAYGSKGVQPSIPPNSTLLFEVELINVQ